MRDAESSPDSRFRLLLRIASGGMGTVYLAQQRGGGGFERLVAVKRAHPHLLADPEAARLLAREARLSSLLRHPNIVAVTDVEEHGGELLLVMEYIEGAALSELQKGEHPIALCAAVRIIVDVCEGLEALHHTRDEAGRELGLVHRDVSPQNVLVGLDGIARLADLGIARAHSTNGAESLVRGKPGYMAAEYLRTGKATPLSDVFALGVMAWETLTGRRLYDGDGLGGAGSLRDAPVAPPSTIVSSIPHAVDEAVLRALASDPAARFPSAVAFGAALEEAARAAGSSGTAIAARRDVTALVTHLCGPKLRARREMLRQATPVDPRARSLAFVAPTPPITDVTATERTTANELGWRPVPGPNRFISLAVGAALGAMTIAGAFIVRDAPPEKPRSAAQAVAAPPVASVAPQPIAPIVIAIATPSSAVVTVPAVTPRIAAKPAAPRTKEPMPIVSAPPIAAPENPYGP